MKLTMDPVCDGRMNNGLRGRWTEEMSAATIMISVAAEGSDDDFRLGDETSPGNARGTAEGAKHETYYGFRL